MRYFEIAAISESCNPESLARQKAQIIKRLQQMNRLRIEQMARAVQRELRRYFSGPEMERFELEKRLRTLGVSQPNFDV